MVKEKRIKSLIIGLLLFLVGFSKVNAASYTGFDFTAQLYDNVNGNLTAVATNGPTAGPGTYEGYIAYTANSSGGAWGISSPTTLLSNHTYTLTASIPNECGSLNLSTYNRIGVGTTLSNAKTSYQNNTNVTEVYSKVIGGDNFLIQFAFTPTTNGSFIVFPYATTKSCSSSRTLLESISIEDLGINGATQEDINNSLNAQTNEINTSINNMGSDIKDSIKDNFNDCRPSVNIAYNVRYSPTGNDWWSFVNVIQTDIKQGETYTISIYIDSNTQTFAYWNDADGVFPSSKEFTVKTGLNRYSYTFIAKKDATSISQTLTKYGNGDGVVLTGSKLQIQKGSVMTEYEEPNTEICSNKIDETNDKLDETNQNLGDIKDSLTDSSSPNTSGLENSAGWLPAGPLDSILNLPLTMLNSLTNSLGNTCTPLNLKLPYVNKNIQIPCLSAIFAQITGVNGLWTWVGTIASVLILYNYLLNLYAWVDRVLTLRAEFDEAMGADLANWGRL